MSSNPHPNAAERNTILGCHEWNSDSDDRRKKDYSHAQEAAPPESSTNEHVPADDKSDTDSSDEYSDAREHNFGDWLSDTESAVEQFDGNGYPTNDSHVGEDCEEMNEIITNLGDESSEKSDDGLIFSCAEVEKTRECFKHVMHECSVNGSSKELSSGASEVLNRSLDMATRMAKGGRVQHAVWDEARSDSSFMRHANELGEQLDVWRTPPTRNRRRKESRQSKSGDGGDSRKVPWYIRLMDALWKLCSQLCKLGRRAINVVVNKIMACFDVAKNIAHKIFKAIQQSLLWIRRAIIDPEGEIKKILDDPEKSNLVKALGVIGVVATAIVGALLLVCGIAEAGPYGAGIAAIGAAASAMFRRQPSPDREQGSVGSERACESGSLKST